jgi:phenylacetate-CoA ligase
VPYTTHPDAGAAFDATLELARRAPLYRDRLPALGPGGLERLASLPLTTKEDLRAASPWGLVAVPREELWHYHESTGTTGDPIACWYAKGEFEAMGEAIGRWYPEFSAGKIFLSRFPGFAPISFCIEAGIQRTGACLIPSGNLSWDVPFTRAIAFLKTLRPQILGTLPLEMFFLWRLAESLGVDPARELDSLETVLLGGAPLPPAMRRRIARDWGVRVREIYGSNETLFLGASCERDRLHLDTRLFVAEVLEPNGTEPVAEGTPGIFTLTHLGTKAMPLVRYSTRDVIRVVSCECGRVEPAIEQLGRQDELVTVAGRTLHSADVLEAGYRLVERAGARIFFALIRASGVLYRVEQTDPRRPIPREAIDDARSVLDVPVAAEGVPIGDVFDPTALVRTPQLYKPSQIASWIGAERKPLTILENLVRWPEMDFRTLRDLAGRRLRVLRRRRRLAREG